MTKKIEDGGLPEDLIDAAAAICRGLGIPSNPTNCFPIIEGMKADRQRDQWQPIETAPKDGHIIGYWEGYKRPCVMWWNEADGAFESWADRNETPSHWMPLPSPPRALDQKGSSNG